MAATDPITQVTNQLGSSSDDASSLPTVSDVANFAYGDNGLSSYLNQKYNYQLAPNPYQQQLQAQSDRYAGAMPALPSDLLYPSNQSIEKGSYTGSIVGSVPVYAPGHLVPFGAFDARQRALQDAALQKQKDAADFYTAYKAPITKRSAVQGELNDLFTEGMDKWITNAQKQYGKDWATYLKQDQGFNNWTQSMQTMAQYEDQVVDKVSALQKDISSGRDVAPETIQTMADFMNGVGGLDNPFSPSTQQLGSTVLKLGAYDNYETNIDDAVKNVKQQIIDSNPSITPEGIYDKIQWYTTTQTGDDALKDMASSLYKTQYAGSQFITPDMIYRDLKARLPKSSQVNLKTEANQFSSSGSEDKQFSTTSVNPEAEQVNFGAESNPVNVFDGATFDPVKVNIPQSANAIDPKTGKPITTAGNEQISIGKTFNALVDANGKIINDPLESDDPSSVRWETFASGTINRGTGYKTGEGTGISGVPITQTVWIPADQIQNGLMKKNDDGTYKSGPRLDVQFKAAETRNAQGPNAGKNIATSSTAPVASVSAATSQSDFDKQWAALPSGGTLTGPDGVTYTKK